MTVPTIEARMQRKFIVMSTDQALLDALLAALPEDWQLVETLDLDELGARLRAAARRAVGRAAAIVEHGTLRVDPASHSVRRGNATIALTAREFALLLQLLEHRGRVQSRTQLQDALYSWGNDIESNAVEVHVHHLRRKLGRELIRTVHGHGYMIDVPEPHQATSVAG